MNYRKHRVALVAVALTSLSGCMSVRFEPSQTPLSVPEAATGSLPAGSRVVLDTSNVRVCNTSVANLASHFSDALRQKASAQLQQAGFVLIPEEQARPDDFRLNVRSHCTYYNINGWLYFGTLGVLPMWTNHAMLVTSTLQRGDSVLGHFSQSYRFTDSMSLYSPSAYLVGSRSSTSLYKQVLDFHPPLLTTMASQTAGGQ